MVSLGFRGKIMDGERLSIIVPPALVLCISVMLVIVFFNESFAIFCLGFVNSVVFCIYLLGVHPKDPALVLWIFLMLVIVFFNESFAASCLVFMISVVFCISLVLNGYYIPRIEHKQASRKQRKKKTLKVAPVAELGLKGIGLSEGKTICLYSDQHFVMLHVPFDVEVQNVNIPRASLTPVHLPTLGPTIETKVGTSFVSVDSMIYCIACPQLAYKPSKVIKLFNPNAAKLNFDYSFPEMNQARFFPAVAAMGGLIYVFGGVRMNKENNQIYIWAEYLDTNQSKDKQEWVPLDEPPFRLSEERPFALAFGDKRILIFGRDIAQDALLYNVNDSSWTLYNFLDGDCRYLPTMTRPLFVDNTMYWLFGYELFAFDLTSKICISGKVCNSVLYDMHEYELQDTSFGKVLMHLKENMFCVFTMYSRGEDHSGPTNRSLECTRFRVTKCLHFLHIDVLGYQSYDCHGMRTLFGGALITQQIDGSKEQQENININHIFEHDKHMVKKWANIE